MDQNEAVTEELSMNTVYAILRSANLRIGKNTKSGQIKGVGYTIEGFAGQYQGSTEYSCGRCGNNQNKGHKPGCASLRGASKKWKQNLVKDGSIRLIYQEGTSSREEAETYMKRLGEIMDTAVAALTAAGLAVEVVNPWTLVVRA